MSTYIARGIDNVSTFSSGQQISGIVLHPSLTEIDRVSFDSDGKEVVEGTLGTPTYTTLIVATRKREISELEQVRAVLHEHLNEWNHENNGNLIDVSLDAERGQSRAQMLRYVQKGYRTVSATVSQLMGGQTIDVLTSEELRRSKLMKDDAVAACLLPSHADWRDRFTRDIHRGKPALYPTVIVVNQLRLTECASQGRDDEQHTKLIRQGMVSPAIYPISTQIPGRVVGMDSYASRVSAIVESICRESAFRFQIDCDLKSPGGSVELALQASAKDIAESVGQITQCISGPLEDRIETVVMSPAAFKRANAFVVEKCNLSIRDSEDVSETKSF